VCVCVCVGNVSIVLRSRLQVLVQKDCREKKAKVGENGIILTNGEGEGVHKAAQYQVPPPEPPP